MPYTPDSTADGAYFTYLGTGQLRAIRKLRAIFGSGRKGAIISTAPALALASIADPKNSPATPPKYARADGGRQPQERSLISNPVTSRETQAAVLAEFLGEKHMPTEPEEDEEDEEEQQQQQRVYGQQPWQLYLSEAADVDFEVETQHVDGKEGIEMGSHYVYVPSHASSGFLRTATPRHMRQANEIQ